LVALIAAGAPASAAASHARLTSSASKLRRAASFLAPRSLGVECGVVDEPRTFVGVNCQSVKAPPPLYEQKATLDANGHDVFCHEHLGDNHCNLGNRGEDPIKTLGFGRHIAIGRFRCQVQRTGVKCTLRSSGKGFLISRSRLVALGGASVSQAPLQLEQFLSPDQTVWCAMVDGGATCTTGNPHLANRAQHQATLHRDGHVTTCDVAVPSFYEACTQNWGIGIPILRYGQQSEWEGVLCTSAVNGITCVENVAPGRGKGFRVSAAEAVAVG